MINVIRDINDYFKIIMYYASRGILDKVVIGSAKRSGKSFGTGHLAVFWMICEGANIAALRKTSAKLKESVFTEMVNAIDDWDLRNYFKISQSPGDMRITYLPFGNQALFKGVNSGSADKDKNAASLGSFNFFNLTNKSIEPNLFVWFEEAYEFEDNDIITTIMSYPTVKKVITFLTFNNWSSTRKIVQDLDKFAPGDVEKLEKDGIIWNYVEEERALYIRTSSWVNAEHLNPETIREFNLLKQYDKKKYDTIVLGMSGVSGDVAYTSFDRGRVAVNDEDFERVLIEQFGYLPDPSFYRIGIDYGRKKDLNAFVFKKCYGEMEEIMYVDRVEGYTNLGVPNPKDNINIAEDVINFILKCIEDNPMIRYRKLIVQIDRSAEGLYDLVYRAIYKNYLRDSKGNFLRDFVFILESWKDKVMSRVHYDNFLFRKKRHYINEVRAKPLLDEIETIRLNINTKGAYVRDDKDDHYINAWEYTNTKDDRRKQLNNSWNEIKATTGLDLEVFK